MHATVKDTMSLNRYLGMAWFSSLTAPHYVSPRLERGGRSLAGLGRLVETVNGNPRGRSTVKVCSRAGDIGCSVNLDRIIRQVKIMSDRSHITDRLIRLSQHSG